MLATPEVLSFQGMKPGTTTTKQLKKDTGEPTRIKQKRGYEIWYYKMDPYRRVDVVIQNDRIKSIVARFSEPQSVDKTAARLKINKLVNTEIWNKTRTKLLGLTYPDCGVLFRFGKGDGRVTQIVIERLSVEPFLLRVEQDSKHRYSQNLADLRSALRLQPKRARIHMWKARILKSVGRFGEADQAISKAIEFGNGEAKMAAHAVRAEILFELDQIDKAREDVRVAIQSQREDTKSSAYLIEGQIIRGTTGDDQAAIKVLMEAIRTAMPLAKSEDSPIRAARALQNMVAAHFEIATIIGQGQWKNRKESALKWSRNATQLAERLYERTGDKGVRLRAKVRQLEVYASILDRKLDRVN